MHVVLHGGKGMAGITKVTLLSASFFFHPFPSLVLASVLREASGVAVNALF